MDEKYLTDLAEQIDNQICDVYDRLLSEAVTNGADSRALSYALFGLACACASIITMLADNFSMDLQVERDVLQNRLGALIVSRMQEIPTRQEEAQAEIWDAAGIEPDDAPLVIEIKVRAAAEALGYQVEHIDIEKTSHPTMH